MADTTGTKAYTKPPRYSNEEASERRQIVGLFLMGMYTAYGWKQPIGEGWVLEVRTWSTALALIPTRDLMTALEDALAQPFAPKPLTPVFVKDVYNALPGQGVAVLPWNVPPPWNPSHNNGAAPLAISDGRPRCGACRQPLIGTEQGKVDGDVCKRCEDPEAYAIEAAAEATAVIEDEQVRRVFARLASVALLPEDVRKRRAAEAAAREAEEADQAAASLLQQNGGPNGFAKPDSGRAYLDSLRRISDCLPEHIREAVLHPRPIAAPDDAIEAEYEDGDDDYIPVEGWDYDAEEINEQEGTEL